MTAGSTAAPALPALYTLCAALPPGLEEEQALFLLEAFDGDALSSSCLRENNHHRGDWILSWLMADIPDAAEAVSRLSLLAALNDIDLSEWDRTSLSVTAVPDCNWLAQVYRQFPPLAIGVFYVYGSHDSEGVKVPAGLLPLQIDASLAFGSGTHGTTAGCLEALSDLARRGFDPARVLDVGTGSGILALAACRLWDAPVWASDIDPEAVNVAAAHRDLNGFSPERLKIFAGDGFAAAEFADGASFPLIIANILAGPLKDMADAVCARVPPAGVVVLSGMLCEQGDDVAAIYAARGLREQTRYDRGDWRTLVLKKI